MSGAGERPNVRRCLPSQWTYFSHIHDGATITVTIADDSEVRSEIIQGEQSEPENLQVHINPLVFETFGLHSVFVETSQPGCVPIIERRLITVIDTYPGLPGSADSDAMEKDDPQFMGWAVDYVEPVVYGMNVEERWKMPNRAIGPASGRAADVISLGDGGHIDLTFDGVIFDGPDDDFAVFENSFSPTFLELATVGVSSDGDAFAFFPTIYLGEEAISEYGDHQPQIFQGFAGRYAAGYGTPFDLSDLRFHELVVAGAVDLERISHVRIVDVIGDGQTKDSLGNPVYDPFPTRGSGGFDLGGVGVINGR